MLIALTAVATPEPRTLAHPAFIFGALLLILAAMTVDPAHAQESSRTDPHQQKHFDIQAQPLDQALVEYSLASGVQILADGALTAGKTSPGISGDYTPAAALEQLLAGAGLRPRFNDNGAVSIERADPMKDLMDEARQPLRLAEAKPEAKPKNSERRDTSILPEMTVTASPLNETGYNVLNATTATKTDTPIMETPVSIQVVPKQVIDDQQAVQLSDALKNVSGVFNVMSSNQSFYDSFILRGFRTDQRLYTDGQRDLSHARSLSNIERVEVLKGQRRCYMDGWSRAVSSIS